MSVTILHGDCIKVMQQMDAESIAAIVTDPPYGLGFMGKQWDDLPPGKGWAEECLRVLKPGGHLLAFGGTRTWHRLAVAVEDAGFEIRDSIAWMSGSGFPKSRNVSRDLDIIRCRCDMGELQHGASEGNHPLEQVSATDLPIMRSGVLPISDEAPRGSPPGVLAEVQGNPRPGPIGGNGSARRADATGTGWPEGAGQPGMEGWRDVQATEGELHRSAIRTVPAGADDDGTVGRLCDGTPPSDGAVDRKAATQNGSGKPQGSRPTEQRAAEPGAIPDERGSQARGGWPVCGGCGKPVVPDGLGTALKPAHEPIIVARKPLQGTVAANVQRYGTGALNIDGCRIAATPEDVAIQRKRTGGVMGADDGRSIYGAGRRLPAGNEAGRWPANVVLDETHEPVLRLRYNLPVEVERTIREFFNASTDHLPRLRGSNAGAAEPSATDTVLLPKVLRRVDEPEPDGRERDSLAAGSHPGIPKEDAGFSGGEGTARTGESSVDGRDLPQPWIRPRSRAGIEPGRTGDLLLDAQRLDGSGLHTRAPSSRSEILGATLGVDGACSPHKRGEGRQPSGELGTPLERGSSADARRGGARGLPATSGERHSPGSPLEILRREIPPLWLTHFEDTGRTVRGGQAAALDAQSGVTKSPPTYKRNSVGFNNETAYGHFNDQRTTQNGYGDQGGASRFFYCAKASKAERPVSDGRFENSCSECGAITGERCTETDAGGSLRVIPESHAGRRIAHPTVKPLSLMRWLVRLATPPGGTVLDPFAGSGATVEAAILEGFSVIGIEREAEYLPLIRARIERATPGPDDDADQGTLDFGDAS